MEWKNFNKEKWEGHKEELDPVKVAEAARRSLKDQRSFVPLLVAGEVMRVPIGEALRSAEEMGVERNEVEARAAGEMFHIPYDDTDQDLILDRRSMPTEAGGGACPDSAMNWRRA